MAGASTKKRSNADSAATGKLQRPKKKQRKIHQYHSDSEEDLDNAIVDDIASLSGSEAGSKSDVDTPVILPPMRKSNGPKPTGKSAKKNLDHQADGAGAESDDDDNDDDVDVDDEEDEFTNSEDETSNIGGSRRPKSKRNNPDAFATSLQKILSTVRRRLRCPRRRRTTTRSHQLTRVCARRNSPMLKSRTPSCPAASRRRRRAGTSSTRRWRPRRGNFCTLLIPVPVFLVSFPSA